MDYSTTGSNNMSNLTLTSIGGAISQVSGNGTSTLTMTMNSGYIPFMIMSTGFYVNAGVTTTKSTLGPQISSSSPLSNVSTNSNVWTWSATPTQVGISAASTGSYAVLFVLSRSSTL